MNNHLQFLSSLRRDGDNTNIFRKIRKMKPLRVGTDCSGLEAPLIALEYLGVPYTHQFSCDNDKYIKQTISHHFLRP